MSTDNPFNTRITIGDGSSQIRIWRPDGDDKDWIHLDVFTGCAAVEFVLERDEADKVVAALSEAMQ